MVFDVKPKPTAEKLDAECDFLEKHVRDYCLLKGAGDEYKAYTKLMSYFSYCEIKGGKYVATRDFKDVLKTMNVIPSDVAMAHWVARYAAGGADDAVDYKMFTKALFGKVQLPMKKPSVRDAVAHARQAILARGLGTMTGLSRSFRIMDSNGNHSLSPHEFREGLLRYGVEFDDATFAEVVAAFDRDGNGIGVTEFLVALRGTLNARRKQLVELAFQQLDKDRTGVVEFSELCRIYDASRHPEVLSGAMTEAQVIKQFIASWDRDGDGQITLDEFFEYYKDLSCSIDLDDYFELMIRNAWHLAGGEGWCANTANLRVLVVHADGSEEVIGLANDLGLNKRDTAAVRRALAAEGVTDIKKISLAF